jgi:hypothetical protein
MELQIVSTLASMGASAAAVGVVAATAPAWGTVAVGIVASAASYGVVSYFANAIVNAYNLDGKQK